MVKKGSLNDFKNRELYAYACNFKATSMLLLGLNIIDINLIINDNN